MDTLNDWKMLWFYTDHIERYGLQRPLKDLETPKVVDLQIIHHVFDPHPNEIVHFGAQNGGYQSWIISGTSTSGIPPSQKLETSG